MDMRLLSGLRAEYTDGTAKTFDKARREFQRAWRVVLSTRTDADFQAWRDARDWTERKYAMWARGEKLPSQIFSSLMRCPCGETFDSHRLEHTMIHVPHPAMILATPLLRFEVAGPKYRPPRKTSPKGRHWPGNCM
jgi:hypothetical protein